jgi:hypothetical protein
MRADGDSWANDSIHLQFSDSLTSSGSPFGRIGTASSLELVLQDGSTGATPQGWGWTENGWGSLGPHVHFAASGTHTLRIQQREDGATVDQIVISPDAYLTKAPGARLNDTTILPDNDSIATASSAGTIVLWPIDAVMTSSIRGDWQVLADSTAAGGGALWNPDRGAAKVAPALAAPASYFDLEFAADAGTAYHLWMRMRAEDDAWINDSIHVQFSGAVDPTGAPYARIGSTASAEVVLQESGGAAPQGWGWTENGWGAPGPHLYFPAEGTQTLRVQQREDGAIIDQIILSPDVYLTASPGFRRDDSTILHPPA